MLCFLLLVLDAADKAITALRNVRSRSSSAGQKRKATVKQEVSALFRKKGKNVSTWKHRFVCLTITDQVRIPTSDSEKDGLMQAGLGEKVCELTF